MARLPRGLVIAATAGCVLFLSANAVRAAASSQQASVQSLVGTWSCVSHSSDNKTYKETDVDTMYGQWLRIASTYPAAYGVPAGTGQSFFGYDAKAKRWILVGIDTAGEYYVNYSNSTNFDGSQWADGFPNMHGSAVVHMMSSQYTVDSKGPGASGKVVTSHLVCAKH
jgi:hypothetical protein